MKPRIQPYWLIRLGDTPDIGQQLGVVDDRPEGEPGPGRVEEQAQQDRHRDRHPDDQHLLVLDVDPEQAELAVDHVPHRPGGGRVPDDDGEPGQDDHAGRG